VLPRHGPSPRGRRARIKEVTVLKDESWKGGAPSWRGAIYLQGEGRVPTSLELAGGRKENYLKKPMSSRVSPGTEQTIPAAVGSGTWCTQWKEGDGGKGGLKNRAYTSEKGFYRGLKEASSSQERERSRGRLKVCRRHAGHRLRLRDLAQDLKDNLRDSERIPSLLRGLGGLRIVSTPTGRRGREGIDHDF